jgi:exopolysaccharide production protein ExoQ
MNLVVCILCGLTLLRHARKPLAGAMRLAAPAVGGALLLLYLTRSRLSAALCVALAAFMLMRHARERMTPAGRAIAVMAILVVLVPTAIYFVGQSGGGAAQSVFMMGRQDTENTSSLSNRAPLWAELLQDVEARPMLGFGYGAFWTPERLRQVSFDQGWIVPHAHNTYLDQALALGAVGMLLYMAALWTGCAIAWKRYRIEPHETTLLAAILLSWLALSGLAESVPLDPYLPTMLAYACLVKMGLAQGSEAESDAGLEPGQIIGGVKTPAFEGLSARDPAR